MSCIQPARHEVAEHWISCCVTRVDILYDVLQSQHLLVLIFSGSRVFSKQTFCRETDVDHLCAKLFLSYLLHPIRLLTRGKT